jgi:hypothetical protein
LVNHQSLWITTFQVVYYCGINDLHFGAEVEVTET